MKLNEKTGLYENYGLWHVPFWQRDTFKMGLYIGAGFILFCLIALAIKKYVDYRKRKKLPLWDTALIQLTQLKKDHKVAAEHGKEFYAIVSSLIKSYFHDRFAYNIIGKTDDEVIQYLTNNHPDQAIVEDIKTVLQGGVIIKFANAQAAQEQIENDYIRVVGIIQKTIPQEK